MDSEVIKKTQDTLGKVIKKPPMTEKLLNKPPFRFLHDIVTEVIKTNGFFKGLYQNDEMNSANVKEKEAKIAFLQKAIDCLVIVTGESLSVRPSKVVAGHEPEKTNEFLQLLGKACLKKLDSKDGVKKVLGGEKPGSGSAKKRKESRSGRERTSEKENRIKESESNKDTINENDDKKRKSSSGRVNSSDTRIRDESLEKRGKDEPKDGSKGKARERERTRERSSDKQEVLQEQNEKVVNDATDVDGDDDIQNRNIPRPASAKGQRRRPKNEQGDDEATEQSPSTNAHSVNGEVDTDDLPPEMPARRKLARPSSARPAPPRKKRQQEEQEDTIAKIGSSAQVANVIVDNNKDDDEDDTFLVEEAPPVAQEVVHNGESEPAENGTEDEHGALVKKMLETKKELESKSKSKTESKPKPVMNDAHRRKQREHAQKEIEKLRESIQTLCRSANPLGKIMDYIQEDMDSMQKELEMWKEENKQHQIALKREQSITESEVLPLKSHLTEMEAEVEEMLDRISTVKCNILRNEEKIQQLLSGVAFS
ncbi:TRAF3-interacting protein 1-like isoform X2 [Dendronephthya gigantea]|uniref:TRAF3-interacting protein 1-like isoform X2 n=1 Tax=Dendronephthya gigantea TaxID=151771 RepID=UPI0010690838|nr:TRAF3-interacting protein 1-like isoform X2 [Dendronephthya gigantea]